MEVYKRQRRQFRREFTIAADQLEKALQEHKEDDEQYILVVTKYRRLSDCAEELFKCEVTIRDIWCQNYVFDEAEYAEDQDKAFVYKTRWSQLQTLYQVFSERNKIPRNYNDDDSKSVKRSQERKVNIPKLEITKFNGEVKRWLLFWGQFAKIDEDPDINDSDKFQYLVQSMEPNSNARQLMESYPPSGENYKKALNALKSRFARDDVLIETYVRDLLELMQDKELSRTNAKDLSALYEGLQMHLQALETLGVTKDKYASILYPMVESTLPDDVLRAWNRYRVSDNKVHNDLSKLVDFLKLEVKSEERIRLAHQDLWDLETLGIKDPAEQNTKSLLDAEVLQEFERTITFNEERRYEVSLPWYEVPRPQPNYEMAKKRLNSTTNQPNRLGVLWCVENDSLCCNADSLKITDGKLTKRTQLSVMRRVFDRGKDDVTRVVKSALPMEKGSGRPLRRLYLYRAALLTFLHLIVLSVLLA